MTIDWDKTWAGAGKWYENYDSDNTGSFVDINSLSGSEKDAAIKSVQENIIGLLEQKGVTRDQILNPTTDVGKFYQTQMAHAASGSPDATRDAFQAAAQHTTSNVDRGNKWGSAGDDTMGKSYIDQFYGKDAVAQTGSNEEAVKALYSQGFDRAPTADEVNYWTSELESGKIDFARVAESFAKSEEANIRSAYSDEYGRDVDDKGLSYWMNVSGREDDAQTKHDAYDASQLVRDSLAARGNNEQAESSIRDAGWEYLGQASNEAQRSTMPTLGDNRLFTAMENTAVVDWVEKVQRGEMKLEDIIKEAATDSEGNVISGSGGILYNRGDYMDAHNQYDLDDWDEEKFPGGPAANPTGMGRFASLQDVQDAIDRGETPDDVRRILAKTKWGALTHEKEKEFGDYGTSQDLYKNSQKWFGKQPDPITTPTPGQDGWTPEVPTKPGMPEPFPVDKRQIEYMPDLKPDPFDKTPYGAAKKEFDTTKGQIQLPTQPLATQQVGQRFTGTSAKGVRMKRSKASRMGTIRGTKQLGREQQTKSLNI
jgi:hypothetical protein